MNTIIRIDGMHCASCAMSIDDTLERLDGVRRAKTSYARGLVKVDHDPERVDGQRLRDAITHAGYQPRASWGL